MKKKLEQDKKIKGIERCMIHLGSGSPLDFFFVFPLRDVDDDKEMNRWNDQGQVFCLFL
jgi:hypothetical protein